MADVKWTFDGDPTKVVAAFEKIMAAQQRSIDRIEKQNRVAAEQKRINQQLREEKRRLAREEERLGREAEQTMAKLRTPAMNYRIELKKIREQQKANLITTDQMIARQKQLRAEFSQRATGGLFARMGGLMGMTSGQVTAVSSSIMAGMMAFNQAMGAARLVVGRLERIAEAQERQREAVMTLGAARQEALINMATADPRARRQALDRMLGTGANIEAATTALGAAFTASGGNLLAAEAAANIGTEMGKLNPAKIKAISSGTVDFMNAIFGGEAVARATPEQAGVMAQRAASAMFSAGSVIRPEDYAKFGRVMGPVITAAMNVYQPRNEQERDKVVEDTLGTFARVSVRAADPLGEATQTTMNTIIAKTAGVFRDRPEIRQGLIEDRTQLEEKRGRIERENFVLARDQLKVKEMEAKLARTSDMDEKAMIGAEIDLQKTDNRLRAEKISNMQEEVKGIAVINQAIGQLDRLPRNVRSLEQGRQLIMQTPSLTEALFKTDFGEQRYKQIIQALYTPGNAINREIIEAGRLVTTDPSFMARRRQDMRDDPIIGSAIRMAEFENRAAGLMVRPQGAEAASLRTMQQRMMENLAGTTAATSLEDLVIADVERLRNMTGGPVQVLRNNLRSSQNMQQRLAWRGQAGTDTAELLSQYQEMLDGVLGQMVQNLDRYNEGQQEMITEMQKRREAPPAPFVGAGVPGGGGF